MAAKQSPVPQTIAGKRRRFLAVLADTANVSRAARDAGLASSTVYRMRAKHDKFRIGWDEASSSALDTLEAALLARAVNGVERPLVYGGKKIATVTTYSDQLGMFFLKTRRVKIYGAAATGDGADSAPPSTADTHRSAGAPRSREASGQNHADRGHQIAHLLPPSDSVAQALAMSVLACGSSPGWRRADLLASINGGATFSAIGSTALPAAIGELQSELPQGSATLIDRRNTLTVVLHDASRVLANADMAALLAGANMAFG